MRKHCAENVYANKEASEEWRRRKTDCWLPRSKFQCQQYQFQSYRNGLLGRDIREREREESGWRWGEILLRIDNPDLLAFKHTLAAKLSPGLSKQLSLFAEQQKI